MSDRCNSRQQFTVSLSLFSPCILSSSSHSTRSLMTAGFLFFFHSANWHNTHRIIIRCDDCMRVFHSQIKDDRPAELHSSTQALFSWIQCTGIHGVHLIYQYTVVVYTWTWKLRSLSLILLAENGKEGQRWREKEREGYDDDDESWIVSEGKKENGLEGYEVKK